MESEAESVSSQDLADYETDSGERWSDLRSRSRVEEHGNAGWEIWHVAVSGFSLGGVSKAEFGIREK